MSRIRPCSTRAACFTLAVLLAACTVPTAAPTATFVPTQTPTDTPAPTATTPPTPTITPTLTPTPYPVERLAFVVNLEYSPAIAFINSDGTGYEIAEWLTPYMSFSSFGPPSGNYLVPSPNGRYLAFDGYLDRPCPPDPEAATECAAGYGMFIADLLEEKVLDSDPDMPGGPPSWSPDSRYLVGPGRGAFTNTQGSSVQRADLLVYDMETDQSTWLIEDLSLEFN